MLIAWLRERRHRAFMRRVRELYHYMRAETNDKGLDLWWGETLGWVKRWRLYQRHYKSLFQRYDREMNQDEKELASQPYPKCTPDG
ncbi:MAG: hypothetical protein WC869_00710 [Phycisphaerae bacterium]|jgi:hypothetical protein